jgi:hypothetical protein
MGQNQITRQFEYMRKMAMNAKQWIVSKEMITSQKAPVTPTLSRLPHCYTEKESGEGQECDPAAIEPAVNLVENAETNTQREEQRKHRQRSEC